MSLPIYRSTVVEQDVFRLDVAVDDVLSMRVVERIRDGGRDADRLVDAELRFAVQFVPQRFAVDERHDVIKERIGLSRLSLSRNDSPSTYGIT